MAFASPSFDVGAFAHGLKSKDLAVALRFLKYMEAAKPGEIVPIEPLQMGIKNGFFGRKKNGDGYLCIHGFLRKREKPFSTTSQSYSDWFKKKKTLETVSFPRFPSCQTPIELFVLGFVIFIPYLVILNILLLILF